MATAYTSLLGFALPVTGELNGTWGAVVNNSITQLVEDSVAGQATASVASGDWTLTTTGSGAANQARCAILIPTGSPGVSRNIIAPSSSKAYIVINQSNAAVVLKGAATTGVTIAAGIKMLVAWNGTDFVQVGQSGTVTSVTGTSPVASTGGTTPVISLSSGYGDTQNPYASKTQNYILAAPNGSSGVPTFRAMVAADVPALSYVSSVAGTSPVVSSGGLTPTISMPQATGSTNGYLSSTDWTTFNNKQPGGTYVTTVSVASANGFTGSSSGGATPTITLATSITGLLKGNGTAISAATSGTDYAPATSGSSLLSGDGVGGFTNVTIGTGLQFSGGTLSNLVTYPGAGIPVSTGSAWSSSVAAPSGTIVGTTDTQTLTNKRVNPRVLADTSNSATPTLNTDSYDMMVITGQSNAITSFTSNLTGTPVNGQKLWISITGTTAIAITWGTSFESSTVALPTNTVTTNRLDVGFVWNVATSKWRCVASV